MSSKMILSVDEDSESAANIANSDLTDILNRNSDNCDILLPVREPWKPLAEDDTEDEDHSDHRQSDTYSRHLRLQFPALNVYKQHLHQRINYYMRAPITQDTTKKRAWKNKGRPQKRTATPSRLVLATNPRQ